MIIHAVGIDQRCDFEKSTIQNFLVLVLPTGQELRAEISEETTEQLLAHAVEQKRNGYEPAPTKFVPFTEDTGVLNEPQSDLVDWDAIDDTILSQAMKATFHQLGVPSMMSESAIVTLAQDINKRFNGEPNAQDWAPAQEAEPTESDFVTPEVLEATANKTPAIKWTSGSLVRPTQRARTVQKDEYGYPIVAGTDAGGVLGGEGSDEDGVGQL